MDNNEIKKLDMKSVNIINNNIEKISELFPNVVKEGKIDFSELKKELSNELLDNNKERYQLTWAGKGNAILESNKAINSTLIPKKEKSLNFDKTKNVYIEGDNLEVLKLLQESYLNKIKCIYIDPPYNTGNDFIYNDNFNKEAKEELSASGQVDEYNNKLITNTTTNGRFHSDWLNMIYPRLKVSRNLLSEDGVIFISIDENEIDNLLKIGKEIYGENNYLGSFIWINRTTPNDPQLNFASSHEYICVFSKNRDKIKFRGLDKDLSKYSNPDNDPHGEWIKDNPSAASGNPERDRFEIINPYTGQVYLPPKGRYWGFSQKRVDEWTKSGKLVFPKTENTNFILKKYKSELKSENKPIGSIIEGILTSNGTKEIRALFPDDDKTFSYPKPSDLIYKLLEQINDDDYYILDYFSGSATTAHACMKLNAVDNGKRKFILVQIPEKIEEGNYDTICDLGEERIRRAGKKIKEETNAEIDYGFRVYTVDSSNMKDIYYEPSKLNQTQLNMFESNIKEDRTAEDLLTQVILDLGLTLDLRIEEKNILNNKVYFVAENSLVACFDNQINIDILNQICEIKPLKVVFRESSFRNDSDKINAYERIKKLSPETEISVI